MVTAATSASIEVAEDLLSYFVDIGNKECFAALLYICFDLLRSDVVEELSWQHGLNDFYMPYKIQNQRTLVDKVSVSLEMDRRSLTTRSVLLCSWQAWRRRSRRGLKRSLKRSSRRRTLQSSTLVSATVCS